MSQSTSQPGDAIGREAQLMHYLATRDVSCPVCRYNLRGLTRNTCPECGRVLVLQLVAEQYHSAWIALLVSVSLCAGLGVICTFYLAMVVFETHVRFDPVLLPLGYLALHVPLPFFLIALRKRFLLSSRESQWAWFVIHMMITFFVIAAFCANARRF